MDPITGELLAKRPRHQVVTPVRPPSPDLRSPKLLDCNVCDAKFPTEFALESHMESHVIVDTKLEAESGNACKVCYLKKINHMYNLTLEQHSSETNQN